MDMAYRQLNESLSKYNAELIKAMASDLMITPSFVELSSLEINSRSSDLLIDICKSMSADTYLSGPGGKRYLDEKKFSNAGIKLKFVTYNQKEYPQLWGSFVPGLSIIDALFNCGTEAVINMVGLK